MTRITVDDPRPDPAEYRLHLSRGQIDQVLHFTHWIPNVRGFTASFLRTHHPGWNLTDLVKAFGDARVLLKDRRSHPIPGRCHWRVVELFYNSAEDFVVVVDPRATADNKFLAFGDGT